ncbi:hypothetical protein C8Q76DRAFT_47057 [Earliella scabrosa]|nr:hypothetical protein C8Q76DRAFT_47057 [Earliella scabrosa]
MAKPIDFADWRIRDRYTLHCMWCGHTSGHQEMQQHHREVHGEQNVELDRDFYVVRRDPPIIGMFPEFLAEREREKALVEAGEAFFASLCHA